jgi:hypothetical protein
VAAELETKEADCLAAHLWLDTAVVVVVVVVVTVAEMMLLSAALQS